MQKFVYPAVVYHDEDTNTYVMTIVDLYIAGEGDSVEEAHENVQNSLCRYIEGTIKYNLDFVEPTKFEDVRKKYPKNLVMLVECNVDENKKVVRK